VYAAISVVAKTDLETLEFHVCPYCFSKNIDEIYETRRIESIQSVKTNEADALLKQGYEVKDTYASSVTLVKYASSAQISEQKPPLQERQQAIDEESKQLRKDLKDLTET
jgi:septin family protein